MTNDVGTPAFIAPEAADGQYSPATDIYSLGKSMKVRQGWRGLTQELSLCYRLGVSVVARSAYSFTVNISPSPFLSLSISLSLSLGLASLNCFCPGSIWFGLQGLLEIKNTHRPRVLP
jgi:serine/threonine protein kinase